MSDATHPDPIPAPDDTAEAPPQLPSELPVLPLRRSVVFPMTIAPLAVTRPVSIEAVNRALAGNRMVLLLMQEGEADDPTPADLRRIGTVGIIRQMAKGGQGLRVLVEGVARVRAEFLNEATESPAINALIRPLPERAQRTVEVDARVRHIQELVEKALSPATGLSPDLRTLVHSIEDPLRIVYLLASLLDMKPEDKQQLLEEDELSVKLTAVSGALAREIDVLELKGRIESTAEKEMTDAQRQYVLRQQLKAIQQELGETDSEVQELRDKIAKAGLPDSVATVAGREVDRLERMTPASPEYQMVRTYLDWVLEIPWAKTTEDRLDPVEARRVLDEDHYDLDKVKERIVEYLAVQKLKSSLSEGKAVSIKGPILCFVGPPGVGKTSLGQSIARAMNRTFVRISLGGVRDEAEIRGHRRTYIGSMPGRLAQAMRQAGSSNPVFMLDEIDKISAGIQGDPAAALLEVLDPAQNHAFRDHYLEIPLDLSRVLFIATANQLGPVYPALLDRMEIIPLTGYSEQEKLHIARRFLLPRQLSENGLRADQLVLDDDAVLRVIAEWTREAGVRTLERQLGTIARKVAARAAASANPADFAQVRVTAEQMPTYLGPPPFRPDVAFRTSRAGVATGVAWTEAGGDVLFIEAAILPAGNGSVQLTGQLGSVMQESARAALSHIRQNAATLGIDAAFLNGHDLHVHVPAGAIPKDGPSAGVTIATAIVSAIRGEPVREDVAMTGEITLSGLVLPVGGIREKALAARRHGIRVFILPQQNLQDTAELPEEVKKEMRFVPVSTLNEALSISLPASAEARG